MDATDRLLLDSLPELWRRDGRLVVIGDNYGALALGAADRFGAKAIRVHQDLLIAERALAANASRLSMHDCYRSMPLTPELVSGADLVLMQAPKSLDVVARVARLVAAHAQPSVALLIGGRVKHLSLSMNAILAGSFAEVTAGLARQKSRVISACRPLPVLEEPAPQPRWLPEIGLWVQAFPGTFAGPRLDQGTRFLLNFLDEMPSGTALDMGCGTGLLACALARRGDTVTATDQSRVAIESTSATAAANNLAVTVLLADAADAVPAGSFDLVVCNPPFHAGTGIRAELAGRLFAGAQRALRPGGELWCVYNSHLRYRSELSKIIGPTRQVGRNAKFTVTASHREP